MRATTNDDRRNELTTLLDAMKRHPERDWSAQRQRAAVLREMLASRPRTTLN